MAGIQQAALSNVAVFIVMPVWGERTNWDGLEGSFRMAFLASQPGKQIVLLPYPSFEN